MGLLAVPIEVTKIRELTAPEREDVKTTNHLIERRFKLDNKDIRSKTVSG